MIFLISVKNILLLVFHVSFPSSILHSYSNFIDKNSQWDKKETDFQYHVPSRGLAEMIHKVHEIDPLICPSFRGQMHIIAFIEDHKVINKDWERSSWKPLLFRCHPSWLLLSSSRQPENQMWDTSSPPLLPEARSHPQKEKSISGHGSPLSGEHPPPSQLIQQELLVGTEQWSEYFW